MSRERGTVASAGTVLAGRISDSALSILLCSPASSVRMIATVIRAAAAAGLGGMAGLLGGLFGVGGGFLVIPLLGFFYGMDQQTAQGTALMMVVPNVLWAFSRYQRCSRRPRRTVPPSKDFIAFGEHDPRLLRRSHGLRIRAKRYQD